MDEDNAEQLRSLRAEVKELRALLRDRLETVEGAIAEAHQSAHKAKQGQKYDHKMLLVFGLLIAAILVGILPEKWQEAIAPEKVSKNLAGFSKVLVDLSTVAQGAAALGAGAIAYRAHKLKQP